MPDKEVFCRLGCGSKIHFMQAQKLDKERGIYIPGKFVPVNTELLNGDYIRTLVLIWPVDMRGRVVPEACEDMQGYEPHFGTCPVYKEREREKAIRRSREAVQAELF